MKRLYVVVRADLEPGAILAQTGHAVSEFAALHPELHREWHAGEKNLVVLAAANEREIGALIHRLCSVERAEVYEPDLGNELTACAFAGEAGRALSSLPLALRSPRPARAA
jgi:peptidyl-tRNA hydrolase